MQIRTSWKAYSMETVSKDLKSQTNGVNDSKRSLSPMSTDFSSSLRSSDFRRFSSPPPVKKNLSAGSPNLDNNNGEAHLSEITLTV